MYKLAENMAPLMVLLELHYTTLLLKARFLLFRMNRNLIPVLESAFAHLKAWNDLRRLKAVKALAMVHSGKVVRAETEEVKSDAADGSLQAASSLLKFHALSIAHSNSCWRANPMRK